MSASSQRILQLQSGATSDGLESAPNDDEAFNRILSHFQTFRAKTRRLQLASESTLTD